MVQAEKPDTKYVTWLKRPGVMDTNPYEPCYVWYEVRNGESEQKGQESCGSNEVKYWTIYY